MKEIKAIFQEFMLPKVVEALRRHPECPGLTVSRVRGFGRYGTEEELSETSPKIKLEIVVPAVHVDSVIELIRSHAHTGRRDIGSFVQEARGKVTRQVSLPPGYRMVWGGTWEHMESGRLRLATAVPAAFLLIFVLLFAAFRSVKQAALVFTGIPFAVTGGILALYLRGMHFSMSAGVGFIAVSGVAVLNGVVLVEFINQLRRSGAGVREAVLQGATTRLRPVLMTALVASLGFLPMALSTSAGAEAQKPLATVVMGGIATSTLLTLILLPLLYARFERTDSPATKRLDGTVSGRA